MALIIGHLQAPKSEGGALVFETTLYTRLSAYAEPPTHRYPDPFSALPRTPAPPLL